MRVDGRFVIALLNVFLSVRWARCGGGFVIGKWNDLNKVRCVREGGRGGRVIGASSELKGSPSSILRGL